MSLGVATHKQREIAIHRVVVIRSHILALHELETSSGVNLICECRTASTMSLDYCMHKKYSVSAKDRLGVSAMSLS